MQNTDPCASLKEFIKTNNGKPNYQDFLFYLNNKTNLSQIEIQSCLNKFFPKNYLNRNSNWAGIF